MYEDKMTCANTLNPQKTTNLVILLLCSIIFLIALFPLISFTTASGIPSQHIQCNVGLELIFKSSNGSPVCVKPETKIRLVERGWGLIPSMALIDDTSKNDCGKFYTAPTRKNISTLPVLLMDSNSTGCARLTFTVDHKYSDISLDRIADLTSFISIGNYHFEKRGMMFSITPGKDYTNSFQISVLPKTVDLASFSTGSNFTVTYIIKPLPNATGFYDHSIPRLACERYPLVVGYDVDQVKYSDFSYIDQSSYPCESGAYRLATVEIAGMKYKHITLPIDTSNR